MNPTYPQWPGFRLPFGGRPSSPKPLDAVAGAAQEEMPDLHSQLEELLGHVRRCERWARLDDQIDLGFNSGNLT